MNRRKILTLSIIAALALPLGAWATDYRKSNPKAWSAKTVKSAIENLYGNVNLVQSSEIKLKMPGVVASGKFVKVGIKSSLKAKSVSLFQNVNPESAVAVWNVMEDGIVDYSVKIKLKSNALVTVLIEGVDGKFYTTKRSIVVTGGGCDG